MQIFANSKMAAAIFAFAKICIFDPRVILVMYGSTMGNIWVAYDMSYMCHIWVINVTYMYIYMCHMGHI